LLAAAYGSLAALLAKLPLALFAGRGLIREYDQRTLIKANAATIQLHMIAGLLLALGLVLSLPLARLLGG
jgi:hypothetical protein